METESQVGMAALVLKATRPLVGVGRDRPHDEDATRPLATFGELACEPRKLIGAPRRAQVAWRHYDQQQARSFNLLAEFVGQRGGRIKAAIVPDRQLIELGKQASDIGLETIDHGLRPASQRRMVDAGDMTMGVAHEHVIVEVRSQIQHWPPSCHARWQAATCDPPPSVRMYLILLDTDPKPE